ncbi:MAG: hypothetical protein COX01_01185, partial [Verrucomicrobia bacterium CG22_combo_CG10-13_8_21_14_all_43_17]
MNTGKIIPKNKLIKDVKDLNEDKVPGNIEIGDKKRKKSPVNHIVIPLKKRNLNNYIIGNYTSKKAIDDLADAKKLLDVEKSKESTDKAIDILTDLWKNCEDENVKKEAGYHLARSHIEGLVAKPDSTLALEIVFELKKQNNQEGYFLLGFCYLRGTFLQKNETQAFECFAESANQGNSEGQFRLGVCYQLGIGVEKSLEQAFKLYAESAKQGNSKGQWRLGVCYQLGIGVE